MPRRLKTHSALPLADHDEAARQDFVVSLREHLTRVVGAANTDVYRTRVEPSFVAANGRAPRSADEVDSAMRQDSFYQFWSAALRTSQEMIWDSVIDTVERSMPDLRAQAAGGRSLHGSLVLDSSLEVPRYNTVYDIHLQPGGYHSSQSADDIAAGAIYDLGVPLYSMGAMGSENNGTGDTLVNFYRTVRPTARPLRILDLGCAIGNSTVPWAQAFPDAEVYGVDVAEPCLRYGHLRANAMDYAVHFRQENAEHLSFPNDYFDIVASALIFHETSRTAIGRIFAEAYRVLKPGGLSLHLDGFKVGPTEPIAEFLYCWEAYNNNEKCLLTLREIDVEALNRKLKYREVSFQVTPFVADRPLSPIDAAKGYAAGFAEVPILVGLK